MYFEASDATARWHDVALELTATVTQRLTISRIGVHAALLPERLQAWDSDDLTFEEVQHLKLLLFDMQAEADVLVAVYVDNVLRDTRPINAQAPRLVYRHQLPPGLKGQTYRVQLTSTGFFERYGTLGRFKPLQAIRGYTSRPFMTQGVV